MPEEHTNTGTSVMLRYSLFLVVAAASLFVTFYGFDAIEQNLKPPEAAANLKTGTLLPTPKALTPVSLIDTTGNPASLENLRGRWTLLAIGYTSCPDVCPTLMATFKAMDHILNPPEINPVVDFIFVSVDPERDSPEQLGRYVHYFNPKFMGLTGSQKELRNLTGQLGLMYAKSQDSTSAMGYMIDHSATIVLIDPDVGMKAVFTPPHDPQTTALDVKTIMSSYKK